MAKYLVPVNVVVIANTYRSLSQSMLGSTLKKETRPPSPSSSEMQPNAEASCLIITGNQTKQTTLVYFRMSTKIQSRFIRSSDMARPGFFTPMLWSGGAVEQ